MFERNDLPGGLSTYGSSSCVNREVSSRRSFRRAPRVRIIRGESVVTYRRQLVTDYDAVVTQPSPCSPIWRCLAKS